MKQPKMMILCKMERTHFILPSWLATQVVALCQSFPRLVPVTAHLLQWNQVSVALHQGWMIPVYNLMIWDPNWLLTVILNANGFQGCCNWTVSLMVQPVQIQIARILKNQDPRQAPTHLLSQNRKTRAMWFDLITIEPGFGTPLYHHVILNLIFSYFATAAGKNQCGGLCLFGCGASAVLVIPDTQRIPFCGMGQK
jgi:hypothetical protein